MDSIGPSRSPSTARTCQTFQKIFHLRKAQKSHSTSGTRQEKLRRCEFQQFQEQNAEGMEESRNRAAMEAFVAKLFATVSTVKAAYAELQLAQFPYNCKAVQSADQAIVKELKSLSKLKQVYLKKQIDSSPPYATLLLAEIQEQQSLAKSYEVCMKRFHGEIYNKESEISSLQQQLNGITQNNKTLESKTNSTRTFSILSNVKFLDVNHNDFVLVLNYAFRSVINFVRVLIREMESADWDIQSAALAIQSDVVFGDKEQKAFVFGSFVCREMFAGFNLPNFSIQNNEQSSPGEIHQRRNIFFEQLKRFRSVTNPIHFLKLNPNSSFAKFLISKYLKLIHPKMELAFSGSLNQRKMMNSGEFPETEFFKAFAELGRRVWLLHCLAFSFNHEFEIFQVKQNSRFSEVYMESVTDDVFSGDARVAFMVVPGFNFGRTVVQSRVYLKG